MPLTLTPQQSNCSGQHFSLTAQEAGLIDRYSFGDAFDLITQ
jgi:hypothetical protein